MTFRMRSVRLLLELTTSITDNTGDGHHDAIEGRTGHQGIRIVIVHRGDSGCDARIRTEGRRAGVVLLVSMLAPPPARHGLKVGIALM